MTIIDNASLKTFHRMDLPVRGEPIHPLLDKEPPYGQGEAPLPDLSSWC